MIKTIIEYKKELEAEQRRIIKETLEYKNLFESKINKLISDTPSGELRNELTELNILHLSIYDNILYLM